MFGLCILNDWSARDIQAWEYQPLGPFLAKNFASTISPWIVTMEALEPFRTQWNRAASDPQPMPYLSSDANRAKGAFDVRMQVLLTTEKSRAEKQAPAPLSASNFRDAYWNVAQLITHHTVNGCNLQPGDMLGTGTLSGPLPAEAGSLLELTQGGKTPIELPWGEAHLPAGRRPDPHARRMREGGLSAHRLRRERGHGAAGARVSGAGHQDRGVTASRAVKASISSSLACHCWPSQWWNSARKALSRL